MQALLDQLANLFLGAIPTAVLFWLLYFAYIYLLHKPLKRITEERYNRTEGAMARAKADIAAAESKANEYDQKLREARAAIFKSQEARRQQIAAARDAALAEARKSAQQMVAQAKAELDKEVAGSRTRLQQEAEALSSEIMRTVLRPVAAAPVGGGA